jgi:hypothetical protein
LHGGDDGLLVEFDPDGNAYTAIAHFPGWHVEDGQSTLIRVARP